MSGACIPIELYLQFSKYHAPDDSRVAGNWLFAHRRWLNPSNPDDHQTLVDTYHHLATLYPPFGARSLQSFLCIIGKTARSWAEHSRSRISFVARESPCPSRRHPTKDSNHHDKVGGDSASDQEFEGDDFAWCCAPDQPPTNEPHATPQDSAGEPRSSVCVSDSPDSDAGGPRAGSASGEFVCARWNDGTTGSTWAEAGHGRFAAAPDAANSESSPGSGDGRTTEKPAAAWGRGWAREADDPLDGLWGRQGAAEVVQRWARPPHT